MSITALQSIKKPWAHLLVHAEGEALDKLLSVPSHFVTKIISGKKCKTKAGLLDEFSRVFSFPDHFGHNWDALADVLEDRDWLGKHGRVVVLAHAAAYRKDHPTDWGMLEEILGEASEFWQERHVPFWVFVAV